MRSGPAVVVGPVQQRCGQRQGGAGVGGHSGVTLRRVAEEEAQRVHLTGAHRRVEGRAAVLRGGGDTEHSGVTADTKLLPFTQPGY